MALEVLNADHSEWLAERIADHCFSKGQKNEQFDTGLFLYRSLDFQGVGYDWLKK